MATLEKALHLAINNHLGQKDRFDQPYIYHPIRIMMRMRSDEERIVALLHDLVEDTPISIQDLKKHGFSKEIIKAVDLLTRYPKQTYDEYIQGMKVSTLAMRVKIGDLEDNMDPRRFPSIDENAIKRIKKYSKYHKMLSKWLKEPTDPTLIEKNLGGLS